MNEKPLHVKVAEALGCKPTFGSDWCCTCPREDAIGDRPHGAHDSNACDSHSGLNCDMDVLARYGIALAHLDPEESEDQETPNWFASKYMPVSPVRYQGNVLIDGILQPFQFSEAPTALVAACGLILKLAEFGNLREVRELRAGVGQGSE
jgi:hypothetical protein